MLLSEDEIDDILYLARVNETVDLLDQLNQLALRHGDNVKGSDVLITAVDEASGNTALHYAAANGHLDIASMICTLFTKPSISSEDLAASKNVTDTEAAVQQSTELVAFVNRANTAGNTALHWAALNGHLPVVELLVKFGADPALTNNTGHDAVFEAERNNKEEIVKWFLAEVPGLEQAIGGEAQAGNGDEEDGMDIEVTEVHTNGKDKSDQVMSEVQDPSTTLQADSEHR